MKLKSELMTTILKIMLGVLLGLTFISVIGSIIFAADSDFYIASMYSIDSFIDIVASVLYYIILVIYLIWIYLVHMDLNQRFIRYPRSPGHSLACMMIPFYSLYGIPSTYRIIGYHYQHVTNGLEKEGRQIRELAVPLLIGIVASGVLSRMLSGSNGDPSPALWVISGLVNITTYGIFLTLCIQVSTGLKKMNPEFVSAMPSEQDNVWDETAK